MAHPQIHVMCVYSMYCIYIYIYIYAYIYIYMHVHNPWIPCSCHSLSNRQGKSPTNSKKTFRGYVSLWSHDDPVLRAQRPTIIPNNPWDYTQDLMLKLPVAPFSVRAFCTISSSSGPLKVHFMWEALSVFVQHAQNDVEIGWCFWKKSYFACVFMQFWPRIIYVKFNIV